MAGTAKRDIRLGVDIGGTFTDVVLDVDGRRHTHKVLTTQSAPERAVMEGIAAVLAEAGCRLADATLVIHGTTLATNALIERKGAKTALVTTVCGAGSYLTAGCMPMRAREPSAKVKTGGFRNPLKKLGFAKFY